MTPTAWALLAVLVVAGGLCLWAWLTSSCGPDWRHEQVRARPPRRHRQDKESEWLPYEDRPGGRAPW